MASNYHYNYKLTIAIKCNMRKLNYNIMIYYYNITVITTITIITNTAI